MKYGQRPTAYQENASHERRPSPDDLGEAFAGVDGLTVVRNDSGLSDRSGGSATACFRGVFFIPGTLHESLAKCK